MTCAGRICPVGDGRRGGWGKEVAEAIKGLKTSSSPLITAVHSRY